MTASPLERLGARLNRKGSDEEFGLGFMVMKLSCLDAVIGADYEVRGKKGELLATIRRKPLAPEQLQEVQKLLTAAVKGEQKMTGGRPRG